MELTAPLKALADVINDTALDEYARYTIAELMMQLPEICHNAEVPLLYADFIPNTGWGLDGTVRVPELEVRVWCRMILDMTASAWVAANAAKRWVRGERVTVNTRADQHGMYYTLVVR